MRGRARGLARPRLLPHARTAPQAACLHRLVLRAPVPALHATTPQRNKLALRARTPQGSDVGQELARAQQRVAKMRALARNVERRTGIGAGLSRQSLSALVAAAGAVEHRRQWTREYKAQVGGA